MFEDREFLYEILFLLFALSLTIAILYYLMRFVFRMGQDLPEAPTEAPSETPPEITSERPVDLRTSLEKTRSSLWGRLQTLLTGNEISSQTWDQIEEVLYTSDVGPKTAERLLEALRNRPSVVEPRETLKEEMLKMFSSVGAETAEGSLLDSLKQGSPKPEVWMIVGVNGAGKTTTIGKLSYLAGSAGLKTLVVAGDTFRAAAEAQLKTWSERAEVEIYAPQNTKDPSAVAFDGLTHAVSKGFDVVVVDTAGRLHTQQNLMEELKKIKRVMEKLIPSAPHQVLLVLDANSGQNALVQAQAFHAALGVTGVVLTKLDGTAKGGVALSLAHELKIPIRGLGVGEKISDLKPFKAAEFVEAII